MRGSWFLSQLPVPFAALLLVSAVNPSYVGTPEGTSITAHTRFCARACVALLITFSLLFAAGAH